MLQMRRAVVPVRRVGLTACLGMLLLALAAPAWAQEEERPLAPPVQVADDALSAALETGELTEAEYALERARSLFQLARVRQEFGDVAQASAHDATLILRDLAARVDDLGGAERVAAEHILARPNEGGVPVGNGWSVEEGDSSPECDDRVCIHWVDTSADAPPATDDNEDGIPDWVRQTQETWRDVWSKQIGEIGYRAPLSDESSPHGGTKKLDVYLDNLGSDGYFGYCTSDDPDRTRVSAVSAYCVIDNDFADFGIEHTPEEYLQVTSSHEFHHASQFAYDWAEDAWLMEGTAANMEETVYPDINDNVFFLRNWSPFTRPTSPLDRGGTGDSEYGSWIFWRYLQEKVGGGNPGILRQIWRRAEPVDDYSLEVVRHELGERRLGFAGVFADFATANRRLDYVDAVDADYPSPGLAKTFTVGTQTPDTGWRSWQIDHLATQYLAFQPGQQVSSVARLRVSTRLPANGAMVTLIIVDADGSSTTRRLQRKANGYAGGTTRFGRGDVKRVEVVFSNGSTRITSCWSFPGPPAYSCAGRPLDDGRVFQLRGQLR
jgi:hypothetical protein